MKKLLVLAVLVSATMFAWCADPNPFSTYVKAMAHYDGFSMAAEWQNANDSAIASATTDEVLSAIVADKKNSCALLSCVRGAYYTEPIVAVQAAAVSQWVMRDDPWYCLFWNGSHASGREVWTGCLLEHAIASEDAYVVQFCLEQLRWCGFRDQAAAIRDIGEKSSSLAVKGFADMVARGLEACR